MDSLPGTPQIQNIIPTTFFKTNIYAAPWLGTIGAVFIFVDRHDATSNGDGASAAAAGEGYGDGLVNEPEPFADGKLANPFIAILPLILVGVMNKVFTRGRFRKLYGEAIRLPSGGDRQGRAGGAGDSKVAAIWAVEGALLVGILPFSSSPGSP